MPPRRERCGQAELDARSTDLLTEVANVLRNNPSIVELEVGGHTGSKGSDEYNIDLSQRRLVLGERRW